MCSVLLLVPVLYVGGLHLCRPHLVAAVPDDHGEASRRVGECYHAMALPPGVPR